MEQPHENCPCMETCPLNRAMALIGGKWKMQILCALSNNGALRYNRLKRSLDGVSNTVLASALRELERAGGSSGVPGGTGAGGVRRHRARGGAAAHPGRPGGLEPKRGLTKHKKEGRRCRRRPSLTV